MARALKFQGEFQEAFDTLERAEEVSKEFIGVLQRYKEEVIQAKNEAMMKS